MKRFSTWLGKVKNRLPHRFVAGRIHRKQLAALLVIALIPLLGLGVASYSIATHLLMDKATKQLEGIRKLKSSTVQAFFSERRKDLGQLADTLARLYEMGEDKMSAKNRSAVKPTERTRTRTLKAVVSPRLKDRKIDMIRNYRDQSGFENIYLITNLGYVFHSANHGPDRYTNLLTGPFKHTNLARLVAKVLKTKSFGMSDFENYMPAQHEPAAFMAQPVISSGQAKFIVAARFSISQINAVAEDRTGLGRTGETYFVGTDKMLRNNSHRLRAQKIMTSMLSPEHTIDTEATHSAFNGTSGTKVMKNYTGVTTLSSWQPLTIADPTPVNPDGIRWALVTDIEADEIREPIQTFTYALAGAMGVAVLLVIGGAFVLSGGLTRQIHHIMEVLNDIGVGDFTARCRVVSRDELGLLAESLNAMLDNTLDFIQSSDERDKLQGSIMKLLTDISALTEGDLTIRAEVTEDMTGAIADSFNTMAEQLSRLVSNVKKSTLEVSSTSRTVSESTIKLARTNDEHAKRINGMIKAIEQMSLSIQLVSEHASQSAEVSEQAKQNALSGADAVRQTNKAMNAIRERVQEAARAIKRLGESSQEIGNIVQIINDIADRTSILALNASIQAAMAGDAGRGFAVVAEEVQRLAEQSANSTKQIETLVKTIQGEINEAGTRMEDSIQRVVDGTQLANGAHGKLEDIETVSTQLAELVQAISMAAKEQALSSENISTTMKKVGQVSKQASLQGRQTALSITNLAKTSEQLRESVEAFTLAEEIPEEDDDDLEVLQEVA
ncbi:MAG: methyl-accepting chemotaxis protein [Desulfobacteraceae bacterium]|jgi:methyl-accepting chemotaxis protein